MPVLGAPNSNVTPAQGVVIPPGSLNAWKAARANHASQLVEVVFFGDSTLFGQTETGSAGTFAPIPNKMRSLLIADGYTSAGRGFAHAGPLDEASLAGALDPVCFTGLTGFALSDSYGIPYSFKSNTTGDTVTLRGKGGTCRLWHQPMNIGGTWTYSINGAAAVTVTNTAPSGAVYKPDFIYLTGLPGGGAVNTITIVNTGTGRVGVAADFFNSTGIVIHNQGIQGASATGGFGVAATDNNVDNQAMLGLARNIGTGIVPSEQVKRDNKTGARAPKLALCQYGVNDVQTSAAGDVAGYIDALGLFVRMARNAGADPVIVVPVTERLTNGRAYGSRYRNAARSVAAAYSTAMVDPNVILGPISGWSTAWGAADTGTNPHLSASQYDAVAQALHTYIVKA